MRRLKKKRRIICMVGGKDMETDEIVPIMLDDLKTHLHLMGSTQSGKSRYILGLIHMLAQLPDEED